MKYIKNSYVNNETHLSFKKKQNLTVNKNLLTRIDDGLIIINKLDRNPNHSFNWNNTNEQ